VLFDGLEITQFTYFQQAGGIELAPISAELTYGLERIAMVLQKVESINDIEWAPGVKYSDVRLREEVEQTKYSFNLGIDLPPGHDFAALHRSIFDNYYRLAEALLKAGLILPAFEHTLKCSHLFNILDASNSIGVTERTAFILNIRKLAIGAAKAYVEQTTQPAELALNEGA
jgi:glycyl-tRNA synthetase alpha chain